MGEVSVTRSYRNSSYRGNGPQAAESISPRRSATSHCDGDDQESAALTGFFGPLLDGFFSLKNLAQFQTGFGLGLR